MLFNKKRIHTHHFELLIFIRVNKWGLASNILEFGNEPLWKLNPYRAINVHYHKLNFNYWKFRSSVYDAVVGAWGRNKYGLITGGIGGFLKNRDGKILFMFSGPTETNNSEEAEIDTLLHLIRD